MGSNDTAAVVTARRGLARASQVWQDGRHDRTFNVLAPHLSATERSESTCQMGKLHEMPVTTLEGKARLLEGGEGSTRESLRGGGNGQKDGGTEEQSFPIRSKTTSATSPSSHSRTDERSAEKRSTEPERVSIWTDTTNSHGSRGQQHQQPPRGSAQGQAQQAEFLQHMWVQQSQMQQVLQQQVCALTGAIQQLAETQQAATAWTSEETRRRTSRE